VHVGCPHLYRYGQQGEDEEAFATRLADELEAVIEREGAETIAAFIGEPVMGAGGVIVPPRSYWQKIQAICRKHDIMLVADEVITGFGRLGMPFGCDLFGIEPDVMVLSKQLTSSYQPLAAILISDEIFQGVADNSDKVGTFGHGFTASGHPVATAVALENLNVIKERRLMEHAAEMSTVLQEGLRKFEQHPLVGEVRGVGLIAGVELVADKQARAKFEPAGSAGATLFAKAHERGLILRPIEDTLAFCPPLIINEAEISQMLSIFGAALDETAASLGRS